MRLAPMRFCGLSLSHNPHTLKITDSVNIRELVSPCCPPDSEPLGLKLRAVDGEGELCGADCMEQFKMLELLMGRQKVGRLMLPGAQPMYAYLSELKLTAPPLDSVVQYSFRFIQAQSPRGEKAAAEYYVTSEQGESLWDICYSFGADISELVALNPQIAFIDCLNRGERVRLC